MAILAQNKKVFMVIIIFDAIFMMDMAQVLAVDKFTPQSLQHNWPFLVLI